MNILLCWAKHCLKKLHWYKQVCFISTVIQTLKGLAFLGRGRREATGSTNDHMNLYQRPLLQHWAYQHNYNPVSYAATVLQFTRLVRSLETNNAISSALPFKGNLLRSKCLSHTTCQQTSNTQTVSHMVKP